MGSGGISIRRAWLALLSLPGLVLLAACGAGGTLVAGGGTGGTGISTGSITAVGSITVNGVTFNTDNAAVRPDDTGVVPGLGVGKVVKVRGVFNADNVTGTAEEIEVENELRGTISGPPGVDTFTVHGQTVLVTRATLFVNDQDLRMGALSDGTPVEVHGFRNALGNIAATRVEILDAGAGIQDELRGVVTGKTGTASGTFMIQGSTATFSYNLNTAIVGGPTFDNGALVEVHLDGPLAIRIEIEDVEDVEFEPTEGAELEVEGFVSGRATPDDNDFFVGAQRVQATVGTRIKGGLPLDLRNGIIVEAKGVFSGGILVADEIELEDSVEIEATVTAVDTAAGSFTVLGKTVFATSQTEPPGFLETMVPGTTRVRMRGFENLDGTTITALSLESRDAEAEVTLQGIVRSFTPTTSLMILGIDVRTSASTVFKDDRDSTDVVIDDPSVFFGFLVPDRTIVKAKGTFDGVATLTATEIELE